MAIFSRQDNGRLETFKQRKDTGPLWPFSLRPQLSRLSSTVAFVPRSSAES